LNIKTAIADQSDNRGIMFTATTYSGLI